MKNQINQDSCLTTDTISNAKNQQPPNTIIKKNKTQKKPQQKKWKAQKFTENLPNQPFSL